MIFELRGYKKAMVFSVTVKFPVAKLVPLCVERLCATTGFIPLECSSENCNGTNHPSVGIVVPSPSMCWVLLFLGTLEML